MAIEPNTASIAAEPIRTENRHFFYDAENTSASVGSLMQQFLLNYKESMKFTKS